MGGYGGAGSEIGALLRAHRRRLLWTQARPAEMSGVSERTVSNLERGVHAQAHLSTLLRLASAMDLTEVEAQQLDAAGRDAGPQDATVGPQEDRSRLPEGLDSGAAAARIGAWNLAVEQLVGAVEDQEARVRPRGCRSPAC